MAKLLTYGTRSNKKRKVNFFRQRDIFVGEVTINLLEEVKPEFEGGHFIKKSNTLNLLNIGVFTLQ